MSVYVDRLPKSCCECVCNYDGWKCGINGEYIEHDGRREDCPLKEIVRCKDCEFCIVEEPISRGIIPDIYCRIWESNVSTDGYCNYGEKQITGKLESVEKAISEGEESTMGQPKSKLESDTISRQAAIEAMRRMYDADVPEVIAELESLPPVTPIEQHEHGRLIDADKLLQDLFTVDEEEWTTPEIRAILENAPPVELKTTETMMVDGEPTEIDPLSYEVGYTHGQSERPKGEWIFNPKDAIDSMFAKPKCNKCGFESADGGNFCPNCGADMRGDKDV